MKPSAGCKTNGKPKSVQPKNMAKEEDRIQETGVSRIPKAGILEEWNSR
jgi:hypothetical protein